MSLQVIKSIEGKAEYVLLPMPVYQALHHEIEKKLRSYPKESEYVLFKPEDYVDNPIALARIKANFTQTELSKRLNVTQVYISKVERQEKVPLKLLKKVHDLLTNGKSKNERNI